MVILIKILKLNKLHTQGKRTKTYFCSITINSILIIIFIDVSN